MFTRSKMLLLSTLIICIIAAIVGCDQPEDVLSPFGNAYLTLNPERLPNNPDGTVYELWVANSSDTISLGKFGYDYDSRNFLTATGSDRSEEGTFFLDKNVDNYNTIIVSVEPEIDNVLTSPASIMLVDFVSSPTIKLVMPLSDSLKASKLRYNMISTSDGIGTVTNYVNNGKSIWFCNYRKTVDTIVDSSINSWSLGSAAIISSLVDTLIDTVIVLPDTIVDTTFAIVNPVRIESNYIDSVMVVLGQDDSGKGIDTVYRYTMPYTRIDSIFTTDTYPTSRATLIINYLIQRRIFTEDRFTQDGYDLPNYQRFGWHYRGWVISDVITPSAVGNITMPAWEFSTTDLVDTTGGLLSTGIFYDVKKPDNDNPYLDTLFRNPPRTPQFPGEDFLTNLPALLTLMPNLVGTPGHVFVSLEPDFYNDSTNFPLLPFVGELPQPPFGTSDSTITLRAISNTIDPYIGFPLITVTLDKF